MNKRTVQLICAALVLAAIYARFFIDWHKHTDIQIFCEKSRQAMLSGGDPAVVFHLTKSYPVTSIEVVSTEDARTNKYPHALWHLVAASAPVMTESFTYGADIPGMKPQISTAVPEPLLSGEEYCVTIQAAKNLKGKLVFQPPF